MRYSVYAVLKKNKIFLLIALGSFFLPAAYPYASGRFVISDSSLEWRSNAQILSRVYVDTKDSNPQEDAQAVDSRLKFENTIELKEQDAKAVFNFEGRFDYLFSEKTKSNVDLLLREAYVEFKKADFTVGIGNQVVTWGKLDNITILDQINPQDYSWFVLQDKQERKDPVFMVRTAYYGDEYELEGVIVPFFKPSLVKVFNSDWAVFGKIKESVEHADYPEATKDIIRGIIDEEQDDLSEKTLDRSQFAFRFRSRNSDIDYDIYYMHIYSSIPVLREVTPGGLILKQFLYQPDSANLATLVASSPASGDLRLEKEHARLHVFGADAETVLGAYGLRGEAGLFLGMPYLRRDFSYTEKDILNIGFGIDHTTSHNLYWNAQFIENVIFSYDELFAQEEYSHQVTLTLTKDFLRGRLTFDLDSAYNISYGDKMANPQLRYNFNNGFTLEAGAFIFEGGPSTVFGRYTEKDLVYLEARWQF